MSSGREDTDQFSVLLSVYYKNTPEQLNEALHSIWTEQLLKPTQIVIVKDGPLNEVLDGVIFSWLSKYPEIVTVVQIEKNLGLANALNVGLNHCRYQIIARMDADDISTPDRFSLQIKQMQNLPNLSVLGGQVEEWTDDMQNFIGKRNVPVSQMEIINFSKFRCPFNHPTVCFRKHDILKLGGYPLSFPEDYSLWFKVLESGYDVANLPATLVKMRASEMLKSRRSGFKLFLSEIRLFYKMWFKSYISITELLYNVCVRICIRLTPLFIRKILYKYSRE